MLQCLQQKYTYSITNQNYKYELFRKVFGKVYVLVPILVVVFAKDAGIDMVLCPSDLVQVLVEQGIGMHSHARDVAKWHFGNNVASD